MRKSRCDGPKPTSPCLPLMDATPYRPVAASGSVRRAPMPYAPLPLLPRPVGRRQRGHIEIISQCTGLRWLVHCRPWGIGGVQCANRRRRSGRCATWPLNGRNDDLRMNKPHQRLTKTAVILPTLSQTFPCGRERQRHLKSRPGRLLRRTFWLPEAVPFILMLSSRPVANSLLGCPLSEIYE
jgi:hypothetical protein